MILTEPRAEPGELQRRTGWELKPEGLCKADMCIPVHERLSGDAIAVETLAHALRMPLVHDVAHGIWCLGPPAGRALEAATAPDLVLPDLDGVPFALASLRGQKVFLLAWASW